jgi:hypothetical protein
MVWSICKRKASYISIGVVCASLILFVILQVDRQPAKSDTLSQVGDQTSPITGTSAPAEIKSFSYKNQQTGTSGDTLYNRSNDIGSALRDALYSKYFFYVMERVGDRVPVSELSKEDVQQVLNTKNTTSYDLWLHVELNEPMQILNDISKEFLFLYKKSVDSQKPKLIILTLSEKEISQYMLKNGDVQIIDLTQSLEQIIESHFGLF